MLNVECFRPREDSASSRRRLKKRGPGSPGLYGNRIRSSITVSSTAATAATATAATVWAPPATATTTTTTRAFFPRASNVDGQGATIDLFAVKSVDRFLRFF